ncbi:UNVERIFIED_CONTAM: Chaperone protein DnaJ [Sesamum indicum]
MATPDRQTPAHNQTSISSVKSTLRAYHVPLLFLMAALFCQFVVLPSNFPPTHYDVLGIPKYSSIEEVTRAYEKITSKWNSSVLVPPAVDFIKVRYAFELLTDQLLKRDYDIFNIDEHVHILEKVEEHYSGKHISEIDLPLLKAASFDPADQDYRFINSKNFLSMFEEDKALLLQVTSSRSNRCAQFSTTWKRVVNLLNGVANTGVVELGDVHLAIYLAEKKPSGKPFFRRGLPVVLAFPPRCKSSSCLSRYKGELSVDGITDWVATSILNLPRIPYYFKESVVHNFLAKGKPHQVKVIFISKTGERATPLIRQAAKNYSPYATFAFTLWKEDESAFWWNMFRVDSAPAIVFLKDPGVEPVLANKSLLFSGSVNTSSLIDILEKNKNHVLPQLRNVTSMELGCDVHGYSRAGSGTKIWYCALVAGRPSQELNEMREIMRRVQDKLSNYGTTDVADQEPMSAPAAIALKQKRLTFAWLDGEAQHSSIREVVAIGNWVILFLGRFGPLMSDTTFKKRYCFFHIHSENSYETCGPRKSLTDVARLFIVRYERNPNSEKVDTSKQANSIFHSLYHTEADPVSTLVAKYNGSGEISEIITWISQTIKDGDTRELPPFVSWSLNSLQVLKISFSIRCYGLALTCSFLEMDLSCEQLALVKVLKYAFLILQKTRAPELVPEDGDQIWSKSSNLISSGRNMREWISGFISSIPDHLSDPRIGPSLMLVALMSSGLIYLNRSRSIKPGNQNEPNQEKDENKPGRRSRRRKASNQPIPPSITDVEPKDAKQIPLLSDSESE